jgi:hypothetical protein
MSEELRAAVREMAQLRREAAVQDEAYRYAQEKLRQASMGLPEYDLAIRADEVAKKAKVASNAAEQRVRELTIDAFQATGDKKPTPYTSIRLNKRLVYDAGEMVTWCKENAPNYVLEVLDTKRFEKAAETLQGAPLVVEFKPTALIASDLSGAEESAEGPR